MMKNEEKDSFEESSFGYRRTSLTFTDLMFGEIEVKKKNNITGLDEIHGKFIFMPFN